MAEIAGRSSEIKHGTYGKDIREPIHDALEILYNNPPDIDFYDEMLITPRAYTTLETKTADLLYLIKDEGIPFDETLVSLAEVDSELKATKIVKTYQTSTTSTTWYGIRDIILSNPTKKYMIYFGWDRSQWSSSDDVYGTSAAATSGGYLKGLTNLKKFVTNNQTRYINTYAFQDTGLVELEMYQNKNDSRNYPTISSYAFAGTKIKKLDLSGGCWATSDHIFADCTELEDVDLLLTASSPGMYMFNGCTKLKQAKVMFDSEYVGSSSANISDYMFNGCIRLADLELDDRTYNIGYYSFAGCSSLESVTIPRDVYQLCNNAFAGCTNLETIYMNPNLLYINQQVFGGDVKLNSVIFPANAKIININDLAFTGCTSLREIYFPGSQVSWIANNAFAGCDGITIKIDVAYDVTSMIYRNFPFGATNATLIWGDGHTQTS